MGILLILWMERTECLVSKYPVTQYVDEILSLAFIPFAVIRLWQKRLEVKQRKLVAFITCIAVFWLTGWAGEFLHRYQPIGVALKDSFVAVKFFLAIASGFLICMEIKDFQRFYLQLWYFACVCTVILTTLCVLDTF